MPGEGNDMVKIARRLRRRERKKLEIRLDEARMRGGVSASLFLEWEMNALTDADCFFFYGSRRRPKGLLSVFFPDEEHAELTVAQFEEGEAILPELYARALAECKRVGVTRIYTVVNPAWGFSPEDTGQVCFSYDRSEYMLRTETRKLAAQRDGLPEDLRLIKQDAGEEDGTLRYTLVRGKTVVTESFVYPMPGTEQGYLFGLKTEKALRRQGLATMLLCETAKDMAEQGRTVIRLQVSSENREAERLYRKLGFDTEEERRYYKTKEC